MRKQLTHSPADLLIIPIDSSVLDTNTCTRIYTTVVEKRCGVDLVAGVLIPGRSTLFYIDPGKGSAEQIKRTIL